MNDYLRVVIEGVATNYFSNLFASSQPTTIEEVLHHVDPVVTQP